MIKIVKAVDFEEKVLSELKSKILKYGDPAFNIEFEFVDQIQPLQSGKMIFVLSKVPVRLA
jgi:hypothetical protein